MKSASESGASNRGRRGANDRRFWAARSWWPSPRRRLFRPAPGSRSGPAGAALGRPPSPPVSLNLSHPDIGSRAYKRHSRPRRRLGLRRRLHLDLERRRTERPLPRTRDKTPASGDAGRGVGPRVRGGPRPAPPLIRPPGWQGWDRSQGHVGDLADLRRRPHAAQRAALGRSLIPFQEVAQDRLLRLDLLADVTVGDLLAAELGQHGVDRIGLGDGLPF